MRMQKQHTLAIKVFLILLVCFTVVNSFGQSEKKLVREGNKKYETGKYGDAEKKYREALVTKPGYATAMYNLGCAQYRQAGYDSAITKLNNVLLETRNQDTFSIIAYNAGTASLKYSFVQDSTVKLFDKKLEKNKQENSNDINFKVNQEVERDSLEKIQISVMEYRDQLLRNSIDYFKKSLRINPKDENARYNLVMAQKLLFKKEKETDEKKNKDKKKPIPSAFAEQIKEKADELVKQHKFEDAHKLLNDALKKDKTVEAYDEFMKKVKDIVDINNPKGKK